MIYLAYDGSQNGDWVARYAVTFAALAEPRRLHAVHVETGDVEARALADKIARLREDCDEMGVELELAIHPSKGSPARTLHDQVPAGPDVLLVCGTRVRPGARGLLAGTVAETLLARHRCNVMALRVLHPGVLGAPSRLLLPLAGAPHGHLWAGALVRRLAETLAHVHLLRVVAISRFALAHLPPKAVERLMNRGWEAILRAEADLLSEIGLEPGVLDASVRLAESCPGEIVLAASRLRADLIVMEASRRGPARRFWLGDPVERVLRDAPCDVAVYREAALP